MPEFKLPIGVQTFKEIRLNDMVYVDKSDLVYRLANGTKYNFLSRPRRFGKSLLLSTLQSYFEGEKDLFEGLYIQNMEKEWRKYPVLRFDLNNGLYKTPDGACNLLNFKIAEYEKTYGCEVGSDYDLPVRFENLIKAVYNVTGLQVVVLIDEYEKPVLESIGNPRLQESHRAILKPFYATLKSCDEYLRFVMLTGVTKMGHLSLFSDLNNVVNHSLSPEMSAICGFTAEEISRYFTKYIASLSSEYECDIETVNHKLTKKYDGYRFSRAKTKVFNPYSVLNAFNDRAMADYWFETGTPSFLVNLLRIQQFNLDTLDDITVRSKFLTEVDDNFSDPIPLLYQSGYLTIKEYISEDSRYRLGIPNDEVKRGLYESLIPNYVQIPSYKALRILDEIKSATNKGDVESLMRCIETLIHAIPSSPREYYEYLYRDSIYLIFKLLDFNVHSEVSIISGKVDCIAETHDFVYVMEFKVNESARQAISQIYDKGYYLPYEDGVRKVFKIGVNFDTNTRRMEYIIE